MNNKNLCFQFALAVFISLPLAVNLAAQSASQGPALPPTTTKTVGFRTVDWQSRHMHDATAKTKLVAALKKVGCEVTENDHDGHIDIRYRTGGWRILTVENDDLAKQWSQWLLQQGMETVIVNPPAASVDNRVNFRLTQWRTAHLHDASQAEQFGKMMKILGCESEQSSHDGHIDYRYRCAEWKSVVLHSHDASHQWQNWLKQNGFETAHQH